MCAPDGQTPGTIAEALRLADASLDFLNSPAADGATCGQVLTALGELRAKFTAAHAAFLRRFDALDAHDADGYGSSSAWLAAMARMTGPDAKAAVRQMRQLGGRPHLAAALARGQISESWAGEITGWLKKLPAELRDETEKMRCGWFIHECASLIKVQGNELMYLRREGQSRSAAGMLSLGTPRWLRRSGALHGRMAAEGSHGRARDGRVRSG